MCVCGGVQFSQLGCFLEAPTFLLILSQASNLPTIRSASPPLPLPGRRTGGRAGAWRDCLCWALQGGANRRTPKCVFGPQEFALGHQTTLIDTLKCLCLKYPVVASRPRLTWMVALSLGIPASRIGFNIL